MSVHAEVEGIGTLEFPDGTDPSVIQSAVKRMVQSNGAAHPSFNSKTRNQEIGEANLAAQHERSSLGETFDMAKGIVKGGFKTAGNIATAIEHPIDTASALASSIPGAARGVGNAIAHPVDTLKAGGSYLRNLHGEEAGEQVGGLLVGGAAGKAAGVLGDVVAPSLKAAISSAPKAVEPTLAAARKAGYVVKPSDAGGKMGTLVEGPASSPRLSIEASVKNQPVSNRLAATEIGLSGDERLTRQSLRKASEPHNAVYKAVSELGDIDTDEQYAKDIASIGRRPGKSFKGVSSKEIEDLREGYADRYMDASDAVHEVKSLRSKSRKNLAAPFSPNQNELGFAQKQVADAIENQLERHAKAVGRPELVDQFRTARKELAKINSVKEALVGNTGDISAAKLAKMQQKGAPLSGNLKLIADVHDVFPSTMRDATKLKNKIPVTSLEGYVGAGGIAAAALSHPVAGGIAAAGAVARPATRKFLLSDMYQDRISPGPKKPAPKRRVTHRPEIATGAATGFTLQDLDEGK